MAKSLLWLIKPGSLLSLSLLVGCALSSLQPAPPQRLMQQSRLGKRPVNPHAAGTGHSIKAEVEGPDNIKAWPLAEHSARYPLSVRYQFGKDQAIARQVLSVLEHSWRVEIDELGFRAPIAYDPFPHQGQPRLNAFLQRGAETAVEGRSPVKDANIWWDAFDSWISIDAWGPYAGPILPSTVAHEFNHALHAACDWYESAGFFETSATYIQEKVTPDDNDYLEQMEDFQQNPQWPVHYDDAYKSWYMYGAALYLFYIEQRYFPQDPKFLAKIWDGSRNRPRPLDPETEAPRPESNEPDWADALENLLPRGVTYADTVAEFARWRWYTGRRGDGRHFHEAQLMKPAGEVRISARLVPGKPYRSKGPLLGGSEYLSLARPASGSLKLDFAAAPGTRWVLQAVPGLAPGSDGELIPVVNGKASLPFGNLSERTLILTALPGNGVLDPDAAPGQPLPFTLSLSP